MMRVASALILALFVGLGGCSTKDVRVGGMMCPENTLQGQQANPDMQECPFYGPSQDKAAGEASYPKGAKPESEKTLQEQGYKISE